MSLPRHATTARNLYEQVIGQHRLDLLDEFVAPDAHGFGNPEPIGPAGFRQHIEDLYAGVSDLHVAVTDVIADDHRAVVYWHIQGTHTGTIWGIPGSGRTLDGDSISLVTFRDDRIVDYQVQPDKLTILRQLGALPE